MSQKKKPSILGQALRAADRGDYEFYDRERDPEEQKDLDRLVQYPLLRWMSAPEDDEDHEICLEMINIFANVGYFDFAKHKSLQWRLLCACGTRTGARKKWILPPRGGSSTKFYEVLNRAFPLHNTDEHDLWLNLNGKEGLEDICKRMGMQEKERKTVISDYTARVQSISTT